MATKKEKEPIVIPPLSGAALELFNTISYAEASTRLNQIEGLKFEIKEYKRSKDFKFKIKSSKGLENSGLNFEEPLPENNTYATEEDAVFGLLAHIGYTPEMEKNYQNALSDGRYEFFTRKVYSTTPEQSILGEVGIPIKEEMIPALSFIQMIHYKAQKKENSPFKYKSFDEFVERGNQIALEAIAQFKHDKAEKERLEKEKELAAKEKVEPPKAEKKPSKRTKPQM